MASLSLAALAACGSPAPRQGGGAWPVLGSDPTVAVKAVTVVAADSWNPSGISVVAGRTYRFAVALQPEIPWQDGRVSCPDLPPPERADNGLLTPDCSFALGWEFAFDALAWLRRDPASPWYVLVGEIAEGGERFRVPLDRNEGWRPKTSGRLFFYANDWSYRYCNNQGRVVITVTASPD